MIVNSFYGLSILSRVTRVILQIRDSDNYSESRIKQMKGLTQIEYRGGTIDSSLHAICILIRVISVILQIRDSDN